MKDNSASVVADFLCCRRCKCLFSFSFDEVNDVLEQSPDLFVSDSCSPEEFLVKFLT